MGIWHFSPEQFSYPSAPHITPLTTSQVRWHRSSARVGQTVRSCGPPDGGGYADLEQNAGKTHVQGYCWKPQSWWQPGKANIVAGLRLRHWVWKQEKSSQQRKLNTVTWGADNSDRASNIPQDGMAQTDACT